jgi:ribulose bisphosphate carboxylase small subunit
MKTPIVFALACTAICSALFAQVDEQTHRLTIRQPESDYWRVVAKIENRSTNKILLEVNRNPSTGDKTLGVVRFDLLKDGNWSEIVIYSDGRLSGRKLEILPQGTESAYVSLGSLKSRLNRPATIRFRLFLVGSNAPIVSLPFELTPNGRVVGIDPKSPRQLSDPESKRPQAVIEPAP